MGWLYTRSKQQEIRAWLSCRKKVAVIRKKTLRYTIVPNELLEDESIDLKCKGLLAYLLSKPDKWEISPSHLCKYCGISRNTVYKLLAQLRTKGYAHFRKLTTGDGEWFITNYPDTNFWDKAVCSPDTKKRHKAPQHLIPKKPNTKNCTQVITDKTLVITEVVKHYPKELNIEAWNEYLAYRKKRKLSKLLPESEVKQIEKLIGYGDRDVQREIIDTTIANGWQGLFAPKGGTKPKQTNADRHLEAIRNL